MPRKISGKITSLLRGVGLLLLLAVVGYLLVCLATYSSADPGPTHTGSGKDIANRGGAVGCLDRRSVVHRFRYHGLSIFSFAGDYGLADL